MTEPKNKTESVEIDLHSDFYMGYKVLFQGNLTSFVQIANALSFAMAHKDEFLKEVNDCEDCWEAIPSALEYMNGLIESAIKHKHEDHMD